jgi:regulator of sirC expression with transglutaminase-like and TPR domain
MRTEGEMRALLVLLADEEERVASVAWDALLHEGAAAIPYVNEAVEALNTRLRGRARRLLDAISIADLEAEWFALARLPDDDLRLEQGCLQLARLTEDPDADVITRFLDATAGMVRAHMVNTRGMQALGEVLFDNMGFRGGDFGDPASHFLTKVIERRTGVPIALAAVYVMVGRQAGLPVAGVAMPGHYLARYDLPTGPVFIDCFHRGRVYDYDTLRQWLTSRGASFSEQYLAPCSDRFTLFRMLNNLERVYTDMDDSRMIGIVERWREGLGDFQT